MEVLHDFGAGANDGTFPIPALTPASSMLLTPIGSALYGTTQSGGTYGDGTVYSINDDGSGYEILHSFSGFDGATPTGGLTLVGSKLYGTTESHFGSGADGEIYSMNLDGSGFAVVLLFGTAGVTGWAPLGGLVADGTTLYGTTSGGGAHYEGTVFSVSIDGSNYQSLHDFTGTGSDGATPGQRLTLVGNTIYGTTAAFGTGLLGTIFALNTDGSNYRTLYSFSDGGGPDSPLTLVGSTLYGTTLNTVFSIGLDGTNYNVVHTFAGGTTDGAEAGNLVQLGGALYGATFIGGAYNEGTAFAIALPGPRVTDVVIDGTGWTPDYLGALKVAGEGNGQGYAIPVGSEAQLATLSWDDLDQIQITFSENVSVLENSLRLTGLSGTSYSFSNFTYDPTTFTATWTLANPLAVDRLHAILASTGLNAVTDPSGSPLDGEWTNGASSFPSGDGVAGGEFNFAFNVLPGDTNQDGIVNGLDIAQIASHWLQVGGIIGDTNGDNIVNGLDISAVASHWLAMLPAGSPGGNANSSAIGNGGAVASLAGGASDTAAPAAVAATNATTSGVSSTGISTAAAIPLIAAPPSFVAPVQPVDHVAAFLGRASQAANSAATDGVMSQNASGADTELDLVARSAATSWKNTSSTRMSSPGGLAGRLATLDQPATASIDDDLLDLLATGSRRR